jgi:hypothetical protein
MIDCNIFAHPASEVISDLYDDLGNDLDML